jgi:hypothetical protein
MPALARRPWIQLAKKTLWLTAVGLVIAWSLWLLYAKLRGEVAADPVARELLASGGFWLSLKIIVESIGRSIGNVSASAYTLAAVSALLAYFALAWYDRIALLHLNRQKEISWPFIASCSFVTYALGHNLGASVLSGGLVRLRAYGACGLSAGEVAILVALCSFTFGYGTVLLTGLVFVLQPEIVQPLAAMIPRLDLPVSLVQIIGAAMLGLCALYVLGSWLHFKPVHFRSLHIVYPRLPVVARQLMAAPTGVDRCRRDHLLRPARGGKSRLHHRAWRLPALVLRGPAVANSGRPRRHGSGVPRRIARRCPVRRHRRAADLAPDVPADPAGDLAPARRRLRTRAVATPGAVGAITPAGSPTRKSRRRRDADGFSPCRPAASSGA